MARNKAIVHIDAEVLRAARVEAARTGQREEEVFERPFGSTSVSKSSSEAGRAPICPRRKRSSSSTTRFTGPQVVRAARGTSSCSAVRHRRETIRYLDVSEFSWQYLRHNDTPD